MKRVQIISIKLTPDQPYSSGVGIGEYGHFMKFIGHTKTMANILRDLLDYEEEPESGRPAIYLQDWQYKGSHRNYEDTIRN